MPAHEGGGDLPGWVAAVADRRAKSRWAAAQPIRSRRATRGNAKPCRRTYIGGGLNHPKPLRFVLTDTDQPPLLDIPYPPPGEPAGDFWRKQRNRPFFKDAMELRLVIEGVPPTESAQPPPDVAVELEFDSDWTARHELVRYGDRWIASGNVEFIPKIEKPKPLTYRLKRAASLDRHLVRAEKLVAAAIALDTRFKGDWAELLSYDWQISRPRSRRGRKAQITADEIARLRTEEGLSLPEIAERFGVHKKTPGNILHHVRKRQIPTLPDEDFENGAES